MTDFTKDLSIRDRIKLILYELGYDIKGKELSNEDGIRVSRATSKLETLFNFGEIK